MNRVSDVAAGATVFVGVDVSERHLDLAFLDAEGQPARPPARIGNDRDGLAQCVAWVEEMQRDGRVVVGAESTGVLHKALLHAVSAVADVVELNPKAIARFVELELRGSRSDRTDARSIARYLRAFRPEPTVFASEEQAELRRVVRLRRRRVEERSRALSRLRRHLTELIPGFGARFSKVPRWLIRLLCVAPHPGEILSLGEEELARCGATRSPTRWAAFRLLLEGLEPRGWGAPTRVALRQLADEVERAYRDVEELDACVAEWLDEHAPEHILHTAPGAGALTVATMIAEVGDPRRFADVDQFIGYCGLYPTSKQSGQSVAQGRMVRKGNRCLRTQLLLASTSARQFNEPIRAFYHRLVARGKSKRVAGGAAARKFAAQLFAIWRTGRPFDPNHGA